mgnify:FL=1
MKFKTRLRVTFISIILLPLLLTIMAFVMIAIYLMNYSQGLSLTDIDYSMMSENFREFTNTTDQAYYVLLDQVKEDSSRLEDKEYLDHINEEVSRKSTYIIVRKGDKLYYAGNEEAAQNIFDKLPAYGDENLSDDSGYFYNELEKYVKQIDFTFRDGTPGSVFIVTKVNSLISRHLLIDMFVAIIVILIFTSLMLTQWIHKGVFEPINELNVAMRKIKEGNFDYVLETDAKGEIGDLYRNYEDMRLRLKESTEENTQHEKQNKELVSNISHDLKTPLTSIINYVDLLKATDQTDPRAQSYIEVLDRKSLRLKKLTEDLVEASKASTGVLAVNREKIGMAQLLDQALGEYEEKLEEKHLTVVRTVPEGESYVYADGRHLWRVIDNLLSNCAKYALEGTRVYIELVRGKGSVSLSVKNISREALNVPPERLMERFVRGEESRSTEGSGLGLSIARSLTELQGGTFELAVDGDLFKAVVTLPQSS